MHRSRIEDVPNPVIPGMNADPSICRVGEEYHLVTSSNEYLPGLPVYRSTDLVSWTHVGDVVTRDSQLDLSRAISSLGLFAPTIRYHGGLFYVVSTQVGIGHFLVTAADSAGPWSDPIWIDGSGWDPSLVFDEGRVWFHYSTGCAINGYEIDLATGSRIGDERELWRGTGGDAPEGPHVYHVGEWWFLVIAEGGTTAGHAVTVARSHNVLGPYEPHPRNPVLTHRGLDSPFQAVGHADLVQRGDGGWNAMVLGARPIGGHGYQLLGRETFLVNVEWGEDSWPSFGVDARVPLTTGIAGIPIDLAHNEPFDGPLALGWLSLRREPHFVETGDGLRVHPAEHSLDSSTPSFLGRRMVSHASFWAVTVTVTGPTRAGLALRRDELHHYAVTVGSGSVTVVARIGDLVQEVASVRAPPAQRGVVTVEFRVQAVPDLGANPLSGSGFFHFDWRTVDGDWARLARLQSRYLSTEVAAGFTGVVVGLLSIASGAGAPPAVFRDWQSGPTSIALKTALPDGLL